MSDTTQFHQEPLFAGRMDSVFVALGVANPDWRILDLHYPHHDEPKSTTYVAVKKYQDRRYDFTDRHYWYDRYTFATLNTSIWQEKNVPDFVRLINWDIHMGTIFDTPSKILFCLTSLIGASLPITGFLIWKGRKKKKVAKG